MEINKIAAYINQKLEKTSQTELKKSEAGDTSSSKKGTSSVQSDRVDFSQQSQEFSKAKKVTMDLDDIRSEQVDQLRSMITSNTYKIEPGKIADKMLEEFQ